MGIDPTYGQVIRLPSAVRHTPDPKAGKVALQEVQPVLACDIAATGFVLATLPRMERVVMWVQDRASRREHGRFYLPGAVQPFGALLRVEVSHPRDVLWAMEEGAACAGLGAVVGEISGNPAALDFTASKRLAMRAEASGVPLWLIRSHDAQGLSAARERWRVGASPSMRHPHDPGAPGAPRWQVELFRARGRPPGKWVAEYDPAQDRFRLVCASGDGPLADRGAAREDASGG